jgi:hypothetical protein
MKVLGLEFDLNPHLFFALIPEPSSTDIGDETGSTGVIKI